ncbi:MAG: TrkH family potassium uptake protein [Prevotella sp.]|nr:TrkH family potassium uptake protein [Prevotella sp.]
MRNLKLVSKIIGHLLYLEAVLMLCCLCISVAYDERDVMSFGISMLVTLVAGFGLAYYGKDAENSLTRRDSYLVVTLSWVVFSLAGSMPYLWSGYIDNFTDAYFEAMSCFSTTGLSVSDLQKSHGLIFWQSLTQWIGGLGIVFFTIAIIPAFTGGDVKVFAAEATGLSKSRVHPRIKTNSRWIWTTYLMLTALCVVCLMFAGMDVFDSVNYAMVTTATGGNTPYGGGVMAFHSPLIEYIEIVFMFLAGINFTLLYSFVFRLKIRQFFRDNEVRFFVMVLVGATILIFVHLLLSDLGMDVEHAFRAALFEVTSVITSTGLYSEDVGLWPAFTWFVLALCMMMGACAGSTSGGIKSVRVLLLIKLAANEFKHILHPNAILPVKINGAMLSRGNKATLTAFLTIYIAIVILSCAIFIAMGLPMEKSFAVVISCISNCGPALGRNLDVMFSWATLPIATKWMCTALMLIGRLEIFSVLVIFTKSFWQKA